MAKMYSSLSLTNDVTYPLARSPLTEEGQNALVGQADWIKSKSGIDRWLGGVHLQGQEAAWRWDTRLATLVQVQGAA
jgi:hypothetical protein